MITDIREYQKEGIFFLKHKKRAIITDEPGLGKTLQASEAARDASTITICAPGYLTDQWFDFICDQYPGESVVLVSGTRALREKALKMKCKWRIINHEMVRSYEIPPSEVLIVDEMHHFRNRSTKQAKGLFELAKHCPSVYGLTATPIVKDPDDFFFQLRIIDPYRFSSYNDFCMTYCTFSSSSWGMQITGIRNRPLFKEMLSNYVIGRSYDDVGMQLPPLIRNNRRINLVEDHMKMYNEIKYLYSVQLEDETMTFDNALSVLHALRAITSNAPEKREYCANIAEDLPNFVVFCWYKNAAHWLANRLDATLITGDTPREDRVGLVRNAHKVVATIESLSEGVDLSHIRNCVFFEEWYTYGVMHQTLSRLQRFRPDGSEEPVNVYYVHANKTIDQSIHEVQSKRTSTAHDVKAMIKKELAR